MSQWIDRIKSHPVWPMMNTLGAVVDQAQQRTPDQEALDGIERIRAVLTLVGKKLASTDPFLVNPSPLDGINNALQGVHGELQAFIANGNAGHLANANTNADAALSNLAGINATNSADELTIISESISSYRKGLGQATKQASEVAQQVRVELDAVKNRLSELTTEVTNEKQRLSGLVAEYQSQFSGAQEARAKEFSDAQAARQERNAATVAEQQAQFSAAQGDRQEKFTNLITDYAQKLAEQQVEFKKQQEDASKSHLADLAELRGKYRDEAEAILKAIRGQKEHVEALVGVIGNLGITSGYLKTANHARWNLWIWQVVTVGSLGGLIFIAYQLFLPGAQAAFTWEALAARVFLSLTIGVMAAYGAVQADKYLEIERRNRKLALELQALGPYLDPLPEAMRHQFRMAVGERSFGRNDGALRNQSDKSPATLADVVDVLGKSKEFRDLIVDAVKAARG